MYDVIIIGAGPGGIFSAYELMKQDENLKIAVLMQDILWNRDIVRLMGKR
mgnify:CR=1 FL=1